MYPLIPWVGVMAAGYAFGAAIRLDASVASGSCAHSDLRWSSPSSSIRFIDIYGDPAPWSTQPSRIFTVLSFINTTKYPPSLLYLLMTLGPALVALSWFESRRPESRDGRAGPFGPAESALVTFGRVPLFFYLLQWPLAHGSAIVANVIAGQPFGYLFLNPPAIFSLPWGNGFHLWTVYVCWAGIIAIGIMRSAAGSRA